MAARIASASGSGVELGITGVLAEMSGPSLHLRARDVTTLTSLGYRGVAVTSEEAPATSEALSVTPEEVLVATEVVPVTSEVVPVTSGVAPVTSGVASVTSDVTAMAAVRAISATKRTAESVDVSVDEGCLSHAIQRTAEHENMLM